MQKLTGRGAMRSPGTPSLRREVERQFWEQIATGMASERAAEVVGVLQAVPTVPLYCARPVLKRRSGSWAFWKLDWYEHWGQVTVTWRFLQLQYALIEQFRQIDRFP